MNEKIPFYKRKWFPFVAVIILIFALIPSKDEPEKTADNTPQKETQSKEETQAESKPPAKSSAPVEDAVESVPLTKDEVLAKFELESDDPPYIDAPFIFVGNRKDTADYYLLADTNQYRNASVIFKDGEIARVKFIPEGDTDAGEVLAEFGITDKPRKLSGAAGAYEIALIPIFWSQNIERYPFELD